MSYCRWSSDAYKCDLYCFESTDGYVTHVATSRIVGDVPRATWTGDIAQFQKEDALQRKFLDNATYVPIGLAHDGESYIDGDLESFKARLLTLRAAGYYFPDVVLESIDEEIKERDANDQT